MQKYVIKLLILIISSLIVDIKTAQENEDKIPIDYILYPEKAGVTLIESPFDLPGGYENFKRGDLTLFQGKLADGNGVIVFFSGFKLPYFGQIFDQNDNVLRSLTRAETQQYLISLIEQAKAKMHQKLVQARPGSEGAENYYVVSYENQPSQSEKVDKSKSKSAASAVAKSATPGTAPDDAAKNKGKSASSKAASPAIPGTGPSHD